jgi:hypothetical protein
LDQLQPGDKLKQIATGEEGNFKRVLSWTIGTNHGEGFIVEVAGRERLWLSEETTFIERPAIWQDT